MLHLISIMISCLFRSFRSQAAVQAQIIALRHQLVVLQRTQMTKRLILRRADRSLWVWLSQLWSGWRSALLIVKPETVIAWHRQGFRRYWTWKIRHGRTGRPIFISQHCWLNTTKYSTGNRHFVPRLSQFKEASLVSPSSRFAALGNTSAQSLSARIASCC